LFFFFWFFGCFFFDGTTLLITHTTKQINFPRSTASTPSATAQKALLALSFLSSMGLDEAFALVERGTGVQFLAREEDMLRSLLRNKNHAQALQYARRRLQDCAAGQVPAAATVCDHAEAVPNFRRATAPAEACLALREPRARDAAG
jgi:hypothetical protein